MNHGYICSVTTPTPHLLHPSDLLSALCIIWSFLCASPASCPISLDSDAETPAPLWRTSKSRNVTYCIIFQQRLCTVILCSCSSADQMFEYRLWHCKHSLIFCLTVEKKHGRCGILVLPTDLSRVTNNNNWSNKAALLGAFQFFWRGKQSNPERCFHDQFISAEHPALYLPMIL